MSLQLNNRTIKYLLGIAACVLVMESCDSTEKKREKTQNAIPSERFEEANTPDSLSNNQVESDNDGNDGTMNGSKPNTVKPVPKPSN